MDSEGQKKKAQRQPLVESPVGLPLLDKAGKLPYDFFP